MTTPMTDREALRRLQEMTQRLNGIQQRLADRRARLAHLEQQLAQDQKTARAEFGTDDPLVLREKILQVRAENTKKIEQFDADLQGVQKILDEVDAGLAAAP